MASPRTAVNLSFACTDNSLTGNGLQEQRFLARNYASGYTYGDVTFNKSPSFNLTVHHAASTALSFSGNAYFRYLRADTVNPNLNTNSLDESVYQPTAADIAALAAAGYTGYPTSGANASNTPFPFWRCIAQGLEFAEPIEKCDGVIIRSADAAAQLWRLRPADMVQVLWGKSQPIDCRLRLGPQ